MARKYDFTRTIKGSKVLAKVYDEGIDNMYNEYFIIQCEPNAKDFKKVLENTIAPRKLLKVIEVEDFTKLMGWNLEEIMDYGHELENRNGKEVDA